MLLVVSTQANRMVACWCPQAVAGSLKSLGILVEECLTIANNNMVQEACPHQLRWDSDIKIKEAIHLTHKWGMVVTLIRTSTLWISTIKWFLELEPKRTITTLTCTARLVKTIELESPIQFSMMIWHPQPMVQQLIVEVFQIQHKEDQTIWSLPQINMHSTNKVQHSNSLGQTGIVVPIMRLQWVAMWATTLDKSLK